MGHTGKSHKNREKRQKATIREEREYYESTANPADQRYEDDEVRRHDPVRPEPRDRPTGKAPSAPKKTRPKKKAGKLMTETRISASDREELTNSNKALFISFPRACQPRNAQQIKVLQEILAGSVARKGLVQMLPSGHSFLVGVYMSTDDRDAAVAALKQESVTYKEKKEPLTVAPFGQKTTNMGGPTVWYIKLSVFGSPDQVGEAVMALCRDNIGDLAVRPSFKIRGVFELNVATNTCAVS